MTERDQKVLAFVVAFVVLGGFWFLVVHKKQGAIKAAQTAQVAAQAELDAAKVAETEALNVAKVKPAAYSRLLRLGKAIPADKDFESLLVQVNDVSVDSKVSFISLSAGPGTATSLGASGSTTCDNGATGGASGSTAAAPATGATGTTGVSGSTAQTWVGKDRDKAKNGVAQSDGANSSTESAANSLDCADSPSLTDIAATTAGLESESYNFTFAGSFYNLKDVYNGLLDMVKVNNGRVKVTGRLLDINNIAMSVSTFPDLTASVTMTGYKLPVVTTDSGAEVPAGGTTPAGSGNLAADSTAKANTATGASSGGAQ